MTTAKTSQAATQYSLTCTLGNINSIVSIILLMRENFDALIFLNIPVCVSLFWHFTFDLLIFTTQCVQCTIHSNQMHLNSFFSFTFHYMTD